MVPVIVTGNIIIRLVSATKWETKRPVRESIKVACRVQILKKVWLQPYLKWHYIYVYPLHLPKTIILSFLKIDTLNFTMYIFNDFHVPFKNIRHSIT